MKCQKCGATSGDSWTQCKGVCPMPGSPHYDPNWVSRQDNRNQAPSDDERLIAEVAQTIDPVLRWFSAWFLNGLPVQVKGEQWYLCSFNAQQLGAGFATGNVWVMNMPDKMTVDKETGAFIEPAIPIQVKEVSMKDVTIDAPEHIRKLLT